MNKEQRQEVIEALVEFVKRATKRGATSTEVAVLPEVAQLLLQASPRH